MPEVEGLLLFCVTLCRQNTNRELPKLTSFVELVSIPSVAGVLSHYGYLVPSCSSERTPAIEGIPRSNMRLDEAKILQVGSQSIVFVRSREQ